MGSEILLEIKGLHVEADGKEILKGVDLVLKKGEVHALMGPNGSGKSTLANAVMGNPGYKIVSGEILFDGKDVASLKVNERAKLGIFLSFQHPNEVSGVKISSFLRVALNEVKEEKMSVMSVMKFRRFLKEKLELLGLSEDFASRNLNEGFSGGEKKKSEMLQMVVLNPKLAILDETDSGLDIDSLKAVSKGINKMMDNEKAVLLITHYKRILEYVKPDRVSVMIDGRIVKEGDGSLVDRLEAEGYGWVGKD